MTREPRLINVSPKSTIKLPPDHLQYDMDMVDSSKKLTGNVIRTTYLLTTYPSNSFTGEVMLSVRPLQFT